MASMTFRFTQKQKSFNLFVSWRAEVFMPEFKINNE